MPDQTTAVVFDVQVLINALVGPESTYPLITSIPPSTSNPAADCLSIAFDADEFRLYTSPHVLTNTARVLGELGLSTKLIEGYIAEVVSMVTTSGGQVIDPPRVVFDVRDYEDNLILDLVVAVDALLLVSDDTDLASMNPWNGRLILQPRDFVARVVQARRRR